ncbi:MAG: UvrD-helicase domain-containing protein [Verrucomicrobiales bacterium]|nr:UvrD-helicase domain-containing protein [Verrucomicrobiales bacterium]MDP5007228.1 UvrD-helicase domain-containing protein [Verrucomicrobiales bacterium]
MNYTKKGLLALNPPQRAAAEQIHGPVLILAGAGTGKTRVITTRIAGMVYDGIPPEQILAVTFTNKAAAEMRERVGTMIDPEVAERVTISTFHSLCVRILRTCIERLGYKKSFSIYTQSDQVGLLRRIIVRKIGKDESLDPKLANMLISQAKNTGKPISDMEDSLISEVYRTYQRELKLLNAVDFDDLIILAVRGLQENADIRREWQRRFRYVMVDEFQDTNHLQMDLLKSLVGEEHNICVVGDDDQSIYGWRGADITNILGFEQFYPNPTVIKLEENYRSTNCILRLANSLIRHNLTRRDKTLWSGMGDGEKVRLVAMPDAETEAEWVIGELLDRHRIGRRPYDEMAILFRMNSQSRVMEEKLRENEIPYKLIGGQSFYERREIKDILAYLALFLNHDDDVSLLRVIAAPPRGIGEGTITLATQFSIDHQMSVFTALNDLEFLGCLTTRAQRAIGAFTTFIYRYSDIVHTKSANYAAMTEELIKEISYAEFLKKNCKTPEEVDSRRKNVSELIDGMHSHFEKSKRGLRGYLDSVALMQDREDAKNEAEGNGVSLITMHAAKGLEFPVCHIIGVEEGILPHSRSIEEGSRDEERRLLYVGITRAKEDLTITWCRSRKRYGDKMPCQPSSFFRELSKEELIETDHSTLAAAPVDEDYAADYFAKMKEMLSS